MNTEYKIGNGTTKTVVIEKDELYPSPQTIHKAELAEITFREILRLSNEIDRLTKRVAELEDKI